MNTQIIMVQVADRNWTLEAIHSACILARRTDAEVVLVKMVPVQHLSWLGAEFGYLHFTGRDRQELHDYALTLEDYGIQFSVNVMQYATLTEAIVQAAENLNAQIVFACLPKSLIPYWHTFQMGMLRRRLARHQCQLFEQAATVPDVPVEETVPAFQP